MAVQGLVRQRGRTIEAGPDQVNAVNDISDLADGGPGPSQLRRQAVKAVAFDFDGTLVDSNDIKRQALYDVVAGQDGSEEILTELLALPDPPDRYGLFSAIVERLGLPESQDQAWIADYSARCEAGILARIGGWPVLPLLEALRARGIALFINSATPQSDLRQVVARSLLAAHITESFGKPASKVHNLSAISEMAQCALASILVVGDGEDDRLAASRAGCRFVGIDRGENRFAEPPKLTIERVDGLLSVWEQAEALPVP